MEIRDIQHLKHAVDAIVQEFGPDARHHDENVGEKFGNRGNLQERRCIAFTHNDVLLRLLSVDLRCNALGVIPFRRDVAASDIVCMPFVLMGRTDAKECIDEALGRSSYVIVNDLIRGKRGKDRELSPPHDVTRFRGHGHEARVSNPIDLDAYADRTLFFETYEGVSADKLNDTLAFVVVLRGDTRLVVPSIGDVACDKVGDDGKEDHQVPTPAPEEAHASRRKGRASRLGGRGD